ncbi:MAG TPA: hypothetical protein EYP31_09030 [Roseibacterium sp.]|nr:hypothetical protein [Roseibacterium sp.]
MFHHTTWTSRAIAAAILISGAMTTLPAMADVVSISRCNAPGGTSPPVLHFVNGGERFIIGIGEHGLTRNVITSERRAIQWAAASGLFPEGTVFSSYAGYICGLQNADPEPRAPAPSEPRPPEDNVVAQ